MHPEHVHAVSLMAAFIAGLTGSLHCFAMCGGMAGALGVRARATSSGPRAAFVQSSLYQAGRVGGYMIAGALVGSTGALLQMTLDIAHITTVLRIASGIFIALVGLRLLLNWNPLALLERGGARFWLKLKPMAQQAAGRTGSGQALMLGFLWGWLPCGMVYSMLLFAMMSSNPATGAGIMLAFGLGTLPSMLTSSLLASQLQRFIARRWPKLVSGMLLMALGAWMAAAN